MEQYIPKSAVVAEIKRVLHFNNNRIEGDKRWQKRTGSISSAYYKMIGSKHTCESFLDFINTLEVKEVDLEKLGEIARHLIAVKEHIEDMRLDKEEWFMLEKIGYPERFKAQKG